MKSLAKDTAIYGLSSIVGRFLNYLLVPLYTYYMPHNTGDYGISTNVYAYVALILVLLTFGMETTLFRFANDEKNKPDTVFTIAMTVVGSLTGIFLILLFGFITPISEALGYAAHPDYLLMMGVQFPTISEAPPALCLTEDAVYHLQYRSECSLLCMVGQDIGVLCLLHQPAVYSIHYAVLRSRLVQDTVEVRWPIAAPDVQLFMAYHYPGCCRYSEPSSRQDYLPTYIS